MTQHLLQQLRHAEAHLRSEAALALAKTNSDEVSSALIEALLIEHDLNVQEDITWAISTIGATDLPALVANLNHGSADIRHKITHTLGKLGNSTASSALVHVLAEDSDPRVRYKATVALGQIGNVETVPALINALADENADVSSGAMESLARFGEAIVPQLIAALNHNSGQVIEAVASLLGEYASPASVKPLADALTQADSMGCLAILNALAQLGDAEVAPTIEPYLNDEHPHVQIAAKYALKMLGH